MRGFEKKRSSFSPFNKKEISANVASKNRYRPSNFLFFKTNNIWSEWFLKKFYTG